MRILGCGESPPVGSRAGCRARSRAQSAEPPPRWVRDPTCPADGAACTTRQVGLRDLPVDRDHEADVGQLGHDLGLVVVEVLVERRPPGQHERTAPGLQGARHQSRAGMADHVLGGADSLAHLFGREPVAQLVVPRLVGGRASCATIGRGRMPSPACPPSREAGRRPGCACPRRRRRPGHRLSRRCPPSAGAPVGKPSCADRTSPPPPTGRAPARPAASTQPGRARPGDTRHRLHEHHARSEQAGQHAERHGGARARGHDHSRLVAQHQAQCLRDVARVVAAQPWRS